MILFDAYGVTTEQIARAKSVGIEDYVLSNEPTNVKRVGRAYYLKDHDSLEISNGLWNWHSRGIGGKNVIDYLIKVRGYSFVDAVRRLAGEDFSRQPSNVRQSDAHSQVERQETSRTAAPTTQPDTQLERPPLLLPPRNSDNNRAIEYLQRRGIGKPIIDDCIKCGIIYESAKWHNCVFVGYDTESQQNGVQGTARYAALRGTVGDFKRDADGSDKSYGFCLPPDDFSSRSFAVFESAVDALSHKTLCDAGKIEPFDGWRLSLGGTALAALTQFLGVHSEIDNVVVCTDNDAAGDKAADKIFELINGASSFSDSDKVSDNVRVTRLCPPAGKDWNDALLQKQIKQTEMEPQIQTQIPIQSEVAELEDKRKDIIFRNGDCKEKFRIKDGDSIKVTLGYNGEVVTRKCRWIDEYHTKIGNEYYHVDEYAEKSAKVGNVTEPVASGKPKIDILAAKYGEPLTEVEIPMTETALRKLVGGSYKAETLCYPNQTNQVKDKIVEIQGKAYGAVIRGKDGIAVCGLTDSVLTSLHPYNAQTCKRELSPAERPSQVEPPSKKPSFLGKLENAKTEVAAINAAVAANRETSEQANGRSKKKDAEIG